MNIQTTVSHTETTKVTTTDSYRNSYGKSNNKKKNNHYSYNNGGLTLYPVVLWERLPSNEFCGK